MRIFALSAALLMGCASATSFLPQTLADANLDLPYDSLLACGACIRSGYSYCMGKGDDKTKGRGANDVCCNDYNCLANQMFVLGAKCGTLDSIDTKETYKDRTVLLQKFCKKRQDSRVCCPKNRHNSNDEGDDECEIKLKYKDWDNFTISLN